jgi:uncharacterized protein (TIGR02597 family)
MKTLLCILLVFVSSTTPAGLSAESVAATPPAGCCKLVARGASDSVLAVPLVKRSALLTRVAAVDRNSLTLLADALVDGTFAPRAGTSWYAQFVSGALAGLCYRIVGNAGAAVTLDTEGDDLRSHVLGVIATGDAGDLVRIRPDWTVTDVFGADEASLSLDPVTGLAEGPYLSSDAVLLPDDGTARTEKTPLTMCFVTGSGWRAPGNPSTDVAAQPLRPGVPFIVRRQRADAAELLIVGYVSQEPFQLRLPALAAGEDRDVAVALVYPWDRRLGDAGLFSAASTAGPINVSPDALNVRDVLLEFDADRPGFALPPAQRFYVTNSAWHEGDVLADDHLLRSGAGYLLRLRGERPVSYWKQSAPIWNP